MIIFKHKPHDICEISSGFGFRTLPYVGFHTGADIKPKVHGVVGDSLYGVADGIIRAIATNKGDVNTGYGNYVIVEHNDGFCTLYGHLLKHEGKIGQIIKAGDKIATMGNTGHSTGVHCHFEVRNCTYAKFWDDKYCVDPLPFIKSAEILQSNYDFIKNKSAFSVETMDFLLSYQYADELFLKLVTAMKVAKPLNYDFSLINSITALKNKVKISDDTIAFLKSYKYGEILIIKLAKLVV